MEQMPREVFDEYFKQVFDEYHEDGDKPFQLGPSDAEVVYNLISYVIGNSINSSQALLTMRFLEKYLLYFYTDYAEFLKDPAAIREAINEIRILSQEELGGLN